MPTAHVLIRKEPYYRRQAILDGLKRLGYEITDSSRAPSTSPSPPPPDSRSDLLVLWNKKIGREEDWADEFEQLGGTVIVMENGYLQKFDKTMYAISVHGHNGAGWFPEDLSIDRFTPLGFVQQPWRTDGKHILVCGQRGVGSKEMASPSGWAQRVKANLELRFMERGFPTREVRMRPHPGNMAPRVPLTDELRNAFGCVIWSSACGVRALVEGIPVFYDAPHWICADVAHRISKLAPGYQKPIAYTHEHVKRELNHMAWGQWSVTEIESGEPFARMRDLGWGSHHWRPPEKSYASRVPQLSEGPWRTS